MYKKVLVLLVLLLLALVFMGYSKSQREWISPLETLIYGQSKLLANSHAGLRVVTIDYRTLAPLPNAAVKIAIEDKKNKTTWVLFEGATNQLGTLDATYRVPDLEEGKYELVVNVATPIGKDVVKRAIDIQRVCQILLTTDKPLYQPNQTIHVRALVLRKPDLAPLTDSKIVLEVEDSKGNKVFKRSSNTSDFGIASAKFQLANELNFGQYTVRAIVGKESTERKVRVERYVLPKFKVKLDLKKTYYLPGETLAGTVQCDYFFGKPVAKGEVKIELSTFAVKFEKFAEIVGRTDEGGSFKFEQKLPDYFVGLPLEQGKALLKLDVGVIDQAYHQEKITETVPIAKDAIDIIFIPESGQVVPGVENIIYIVTTYPDGKPAVCDLIVNEIGEKPAVLVKTDELGVGEYRTTPLAEGLGIKVTARDELGNEAEKTEQFGYELTKDNILLRPAKAIYEVGELLKFYILSTFKTGTVYLDVIKDKQTVLTKTTELSDGRGYFDWALTGDLAGTLEVHAYKILPTGDMVRDTRLVYVNPATDLMIKVASDKKIYLPRDKSKIDFTVMDKLGKPVISALGIDVVDESVFALAEREPGLEKIYFTLEKEIMKPRYEIHGFEPGVIILKGRKPEAEEEVLRQEAGTVLFAMAPELAKYTIAVNTYAERISEYKEKWAKQMEKDAQKISLALEQFRQRHNRYPTEEEGLNVLVQGGFLSRIYTLDLWGRRYKLEMVPERGAQFKLVSLGPDGREGTVDDIVIYGWAGGRQVFKEVGGMAGVRFKGIPGPPGAAGEMEMLMPEAATIMAAMPEAVPAVKPVLVRQFFPETLWVNPEVITDEKGRATVVIELADSITTWRLSAMGSSQKGELGSTSYPIVVFKDFFIDLDLPVALTQNDEVSVPVAVYNYLDESQVVKLKLVEQDWFELLDTPEKTLKIGKNDIDAVYFKLKAKQVGRYKLTVYGYGTKQSDAISRDIEIVPDGKEFVDSLTGRLDKDVEQVLNIPKEAIAGASNILVKIYPGLLSQAVEGLDKILRMPFGCFEQTSSVTYPNILVLDYMKSTKQINPEIQMKAEGFINLGYQRLVSYEVPGGGFSWFGNPPANKILTAYGLMEFTDMARVYEIDPNLITRTQEWLLKQQEEDGTWSPDKEYLHGEAWGNIQKIKILPTAYISWALLESGYAGDKVNPAVKYLKANWEELKDPYSLGLVVNALVTVDKSDPDARRIFDRLMEMKIEKEDMVYWESGLSTITHSTGLPADIEATAIIAYALIRSDLYPGITQKVLNFLIQSKDPEGTWHSTQATVMALRTLVKSIAKAGEGISAKGEILINGEKAAGYEITPEDSDVLRQFDLKEYVKVGANEVEVTFRGEGSAFYQMVAKYYLPWKRVEVPVKELLSIKVDYDKRQLAKDDLVTCSVKISNNRPGVANMVIVDLGIPPGFAVQVGDLEELVKAGVINKFNLTGREVIVYLEKVDSKAPVEFEYRLKAKFPIRAKTPQSRAYEYYNPAVEAVAQPVELEVR